MTAFTPPSLPFFPTESFESDALKGLRNTIRLANNPLHTTNSSPTLTGRGRQDSSACLPTSQRKADCTFQAVWMDAPSTGTLEHTCSCKPPQTRREKNENKCTIAAFLLQSTLKIIKCARNLEQVEQVKDAT